MPNGTDKNNDNGSMNRRKFDFVTETICDRIYIENNRRFESIEKTNKDLIKELKEISKSINEFIFTYLKKEASSKALIIVGKISVVLIPILISLIGMSALYIITKTPVVK